MRSWKEAPKATGDCSNFFFSFLGFFCFGFFFSFYSGSLNYSTILPTNLSLKLDIKSKGYYFKVYRFLILLVLSSRPWPGALAIVVKGRFFSNAPGVFGEFGSDGLWDIYPKLLVFFDFVDVGPLAASLDPKLVISSVTLPSDFAVLFPWVFSDFVTFMSDSSLPPVAPPRLGGDIL